MTTEDIINNALSKIKLSYSNDKITELKDSRYHYKKGFTGDRYDKNRLNIVNNKFIKILIKRTDEQIQSVNKYI